MQARTAKGRAPARGKAQAIAADGMVGRIVERLIDNPAMTGGLFVMALTATAIVSNAMFLQHGRHPEPLFMTRPAVDAPVPVPLPKTRVEPVEEMPPIPRIAPTPAPTPAAARIAPDTKLVLSLQRALASRGLYGGALDGITGSRTRAAITAYEKEQGLPVTGEPSPEILDRITTGSVKPAPKPVAPLKADKIAYTPTPVKPAPVMVEKVAVAPIPVAAPKPVPVKAVTPEPLPVVVAAVPTPGPAVALRARYAKVQDALNQIGYGPLPTDGEGGDDSENAIRRFELDNGLPITGKAGDRVVARLTAIGAMPAN